MLPESRDTASLVHAHVWQHITRVGKKPAAYESTAASSEKRWHSSVSVKCGMSIEASAYLRCGTIRADLCQSTGVPSLGTAPTVASGFAPGRPTPSPCPLTASPGAWAAPHAARFRAAWASRSHSQPQRGHRYTRTPRANCALGRHPPPAQTCVEGNRRSASTHSTPRGGAVPCELRRERTQARVGQGLGPPPVANPAADVERLDPHRAGGLRHGGRGPAVGGPSLPTETAMPAGALSAEVLPPVGVPVPAVRVATAGDGLVAASQLAFGRLQCPRVGEWATVRSESQRLDAHVNPAPRTLAGRCGRGRVEGAHEGHEPASRRTCTCSGRPPSWSGSDSALIPQPTLGRRMLHPSMRMRSGWPSPAAHAALDPRL